MRELVRGCLVVYCVVTICDRVLKLLHSAVAPPRLAPLWESPIKSMSMCTSQAPRLLTGLVAGVRSPAWHKAVSRLVLTGVIP